MLCLCFVFVPTKQTYLSRSRGRHSDHRHLQNNIIFQSRMDTSRSNFKTIASGLLGLLSSFGSGDPPTIDGHTYRGLGFCENAQGTYYSYNTIPDISTPEECAISCTQQYSSDEKYVGINFHPAWFGSPNCNCMMTNLWSSGKIVGANAWNEELCYSWDEVSRVIV